MKKLLPARTGAMFLSWKRNLVLSVMIAVLTLEASAASYAQKININVHNATLKEVFKEIHKQISQDFIYSNQVLEISRPVNLVARDEALESVLKKAFADQPLEYTITQRTIIVKVKQQPKSSSLQERNISGTVYASAESTPLAGVSVTVKGTAIGTTTNGDGKYRLALPAGKNVLVFRFIGYTSREISSGSSNQLDVRLEEESQQLDAVVVQAYGTVKRGALTNSIATVNAKDFEKRPITNLSTALAGAAPGIQTSSGSGQPGSGLAIRIRGFGSVTGGMDPLYVLDGAPYDGVLSSINPNDIESISILKDASASALYGARAANGVIMVTTKKGAKNRDVIELKVTTGITSRGLSNYEKVDAFQYYPLLWESLRNQTLANGGTLAAANLTATNNIKTNLVYNPFNVPDNQIVGTDGTINPSASLLYPDDLSYRDAMQRTGVRQNYSLGFRGGAEKSTYFVSMDYLDDKGFSKMSDFNRLTGRAKVDIQPKKWLKAGVNLAGTLSKTLSANEDAGINENPFYVDLLMAPIYPVYKHDATGAFVLDEKGEKVYDDGELRPQFQGRNILAETMANQLYNKRNALNARTYAEVTFLKDFKFTANLSVDLNNYEYLFYRNPEIGDGKSVNGSTNRSNSKTQSANINQLLNYNKTLGKHHVDVLLGHEYYNYNYTYLSASRSNLVVTGPVELDNYTNPAVVNSYVNTYKIDSYFSRGQYDYDNRYFLSASYRRDGSSKFSPESRWGNFWSVGAGWQLNSESFLKDKEWIDILKLRASYGQVGSDALNGYYLYQSYYDIGNNNNTEAGITQARAVGNTNLRWESNGSFDAGVDFGFFKNRLNGTLEYFNRDSKGLLFNVPLPVSTGLSQQPQNIGSMYNRGVEIQLGGDVIRKTDFTWNVNVNWTKFKNKITKMPDGQASIIDGTKNRQVGQSMYDYWLRDWYGVDPANGKELYAADPTVTDAAAFTNDRGDKVTTDANSARYHYAGTAIPDFYGSLNNSFSYKNFSLSFLVMYQSGGLAFDSDYQSLMYNGSYGRALHVDALNRWQKPGDITDVPIRNTGTTMYDSDRWLIDASSVSLRTASLTYSLPGRLAGKIGAGKAQVFATGENLFIISRRKGLDPTQSFTGVSSYSYAPTRVLTLGVNINL